MRAWQKVQCPVCHKVLFEAFGITSHILIKIHCRCKRVIQVKEGWVAEALQEQQPASR
jgi:phage FluMu protein Com